MSILLAIGYNLIALKLKHYLIPTEYNDYKPWLLTPQALAVFCVVIWGIRFLLPNTFTIAAPSIDPTDLMNKINFERTQRFIAGLATNSKLVSAANGKSQDMLDRSYFAHIDPDGNYVWVRIEAAGFTPYLTLGENLAMGYTDADSVTNAWMNSPTHRTNILNTKFEDQGLASLFGLYEPNQEAILITSLFGTLYNKTTPAPPPTPKPAPPPLPTPTPTPTPIPTPTPPPPQPKVEIKIFKDLKIQPDFTSNQTKIGVDIVIQGKPTLVTATLKAQSITLLPSQTDGQYLGTFTFNPGENLENQALVVEARDQDGAKTFSEFPVNISSPGVSGLEDETSKTIPTEVASNEAGVIKILRLLFGIFAAIYMGFLIIDALIIHRAKIQRPGIHSHTHILLFLLIAAVALFTNW